MTNELKGVHAEIDIATGQVVALAVPGHPDAYKGCATIWTPLEVNSDLLRAALGAGDHAWRYPEARALGEALDELEATGAARVAVESQVGRALQLRREAEAQCERAQAERQVLQVDLNQCRRTLNSIRRELDTDAPDSDIWSVVQERIGEPRSAKRLPTLNALGAAAFKIAESKGWWEDYVYDPSAPRGAYIDSLRPEQVLRSHDGRYAMTTTEALGRLMLMNTESAEAAEDIRDGNVELTKSSTSKPEGLPSELADLFIRLVQDAYAWGIDLDTAVADKMAYNRTREHRHGASSGDGLSAGATHEKGPPRLRGWPGGGVGSQRRVGSALKKI